MKAANDNERDPWSSIGLAAAMILNRLRTQRHLLELEDEKPSESRTDNGEAENNEKQKRDTERAYIEQRLRDIAAFERRAKGIVKHRVRRKRP